MLVGVGQVLSVGLLDHFRRALELGLVVEAQLDEGGDEESLGCVALVGERVGDDEEGDEGDAEDAVGTVLAGVLHHDHGDEDGEEDGDDVQVDAVEPVHRLAVVVELALRAQELAVARGLAVGQVRQEGVGEGLLADQVEETSGLLLPAVLLLILAVETDRLPLLALVVDLRRFGLRGKGST